MIKGRFSIISNHVVLLTLTLIFFVPATSLAYDHSVLFGGSKLLHGNSALQIYYQKYSLFLTRKFRNIFSIHYEVGASIWQFSDGKEYSIDISPIVMYELQSKKTNGYFLESGIGGAYISDRSLASQHMGSHFQFRDMIGIGKFLDKNKKYNLRLRYMHYSNADLADKNDGVDSFVVLLAFSF